VAALVVEHQPADVTEVAALEVPAVHRQREPVHEHDGQIRAQVAVDLDMQRYAVVGDDRATFRMQATERFVDVRIGSVAGAADRAPASSDAAGDTDGGHCGGRGGDAGP